jgi:hypothetical protein
MSNRILDVTAIDRLSTLAAIARDNGLAISIDFLSSDTKNGVGSDVWIVQVYDYEERLVVSGRGKSAVEAIKHVHDNWFAKHLPKV